MQGKGKDEINKTQKTLLIYLQNIINCERSI